MKRFSEDERDYVHRVAGKVPIEAMAEQLERSTHSVRHFCQKEQLSIAVPAWRMQLFWQHITEQRKAKGASR